MRHWKHEKIISKNLKKGVDKWWMVWYSNKAVAEVTTSAETKTAKKRILDGLNVENFSKKFEKSS